MSGPDPSQGCPDYQEAKAEVWPFSFDACRHWAGGSFCSLPEHFCHWRSWWLAPDPEWLKQPQRILGKLQ